MLGVIRSCNSKMNRQYNGQKETMKKSQAMLEITLHRKLKINMKATKTRNDLICSGKVISSCFISGAPRVTLVTNPVKS